jgi:hypothetical protein
MGSQTTKIASSRPLALALLIGLCAIVAPRSAVAIIVGPGPHNFDGNLPGQAFVEYNGTSFTTPAVLPTAVFGVIVDGGITPQLYPGTSFSITGGFTIIDAFAFDSDANGVDFGDPLFGTIGPGTFEFNNGVGLIVGGSFLTATLNSTVGSTAGSLSASDINGLVLTPGPAFTFDTSFVSSIDLIPTGFGISLSSIPIGVAAAAAGPAVGPFIPVTLASFGLSTGSAVVSGRINVVPEPSSMALLGLGILALATPAYRRWRRKSSL